MITLYGKKYAANDREATGTLFDGDGQTANGTYKVTPRGIFLTSLNARHRAFIRRDGFGPVTVSKHNGRDWFMFGMASIDEEAFGVPDSFIEECDGAKALAREVFST